MISGRRPLNTRLLILCNLVLFTVVQSSILGLDLFFIALGGLKVSTPNAVIVILMAIVTPGLVGFLIFAIRQRVKTKAGASTQLNPYSFLTVAFVLTILWEVPIVVGLITASKNPTCARDAWQRLCLVHRTMTSMCMVLLPVVWSLILSLWLSYRGLNATIPDATESEDTSHPSWHTKATVTPSATACGRKDEKLLYSTPGSQLSTTEHELWLQRRNSVSSQKAVNPRAHQFMDHRCLTQTRYSASRLLPFSNEVSEFSLPRPKSCCIDSMFWSPSNSIVTPTTYELSGSKRNSMYRFSAASNVQTPSPSRMLNSRTNISLMSSTTLARNRSPSPPPPTWCPKSLKQTPLSADPAIRAFSINTDIENTTTESLYLKEHAKTPSPIKLMVRPLGRSHTASDIPSSISTRLLPLTPPPSSSISRLTSVNESPISPSTPCPLRPPPRAPGHVITTIPRNSSSTTRPLRRPSRIGRRESLIYHNNQTQTRNQTHHRPRPSQYDVRPGTSASSDIWEVLQDRSANLPLASTRMSESGELDKWQQRQQENMDVRAAKRPISSVYSLASVRGARDRDSMVLGSDDWRRGGVVGCWESIKE